MEIYIPRYHIPEQSQDLADDISQRLKLPNLSRPLSLALSHPELFSQSPTVALATLRKRARPNIPGGTIIIANFPVKQSPSKTSPTIIIQESLIGTLPTAEFNRLQIVTVTKPAQRRNQVDTLVENLYRTTHGMAFLMNTEPIFFAQAILR